MYHVHLHHLTVSSEQCSVCAAGGKSFWCQAIHLLAAWAASASVHPVRRQCLLRRLTGCIDALAAECSYDWCSDVPERAPCSTRCHSSHMPYCISTSTCCHSSHMTYRISTTHRHETKHRFTRRSFSYAAPVICNSLPADILMSSCKSGFKRCLDTFL